MIWEEMPPMYSGAPDLVGRQSPRGRHGAEHLTQAGKGSLTLHCYHK